MYVTLMIFLLNLLTIYGQILLVRTKWEVKNYMLCNQQ
jgi:hypothetical protein